MEQNKLQDAKNILIEAIEEHGQDPSMLTNLAIAETNLGNYSIAQSLYQEVINIMPNAFLGHFNMSKFKLATGRPEEAKNHLEQADCIVANTPESTQLHRKITDTIGEGKTLEARIYKSIENKNWDKVCLLLTSCKQELTINEWLAAICELPKEYQVKLDSAEVCDPYSQVRSYQIFDHHSDYRLDLINAIRSEPSLTWNRIGKPTTGGQQTHELLAQSNNPFIQQLNEKIKDLIAKIIGTNPLTI